LRLRLQSRAQRGGGGEGGDRKGDHAGRRRRWIHSWLV
jgi:hypothetical protein